MRVFVKVSGTGINIRTTRGCFEAKVEVISPRPKKYPRTDRDS